MVKMVEEKDLSGNRLGSCIETFNMNKCHLKPEWRKWLRTTDENSDIKDQILQDLTFSFLKK
jgi:hypothetical protein